MVVVVVMVIMVVLDIVSMNKNHNESLLFIFSWLLQVKCLILANLKNAFQTDRPTDGPTDGRTDRRTDGHTLIEMLGRI